MALEIVYGESRDRTLANRLASALQNVVAEGTAYLGYPVLVTADDRVNIDALLVSPEHGLVAFLFSDESPRSETDWAAEVHKQDALYSALDTLLRKHDSLRIGRQLAVTPNTATIFPVAVDDTEEREGFYGAIDGIGAWIETLPALDGIVLTALQAALQRVSTIKPSKRRPTAQTPESRGSIMKAIEKRIANLDRWQKAAAIESPEGPQRIRGLAGSGKTVVLALKAAYLHAQHPDWTIAFTFHTRALYQQIVDLVTRFTFAQSEDQPDTERLRIMHSWGSRGEPGIYSAIAAAIGAEIRDFSYASGKYGRDNAFQGVCAELLASLGSKNVSPIFDAVLIDEAQDLPPEFFQLVYQFTKDPKRIVWAYDELQKLDEATMPDTDQLFGTGSKGVPLVSLESTPGGPQRDIVLPVCYRNTPWALATAHALGIGVYRKEGLLQHPDQPGLWRDIGYDVLSGQLALGSPVVLKRSDHSSPEYFANLLTTDDAVQCVQFVDEEQQDEWVAHAIKQNLEADELEPDDILIVLPDTYRAKSRAPRLMKWLRKVGVESHLVGVNTSRDVVFVSGSVALAHIYRAKGNEAPMVYVMDAQYAAQGVNLVTKRNMIFTAITRSRAWVRVLGYGEGMKVIGQELEEVRTNGFELRFEIPSHERLREIRHIYRERTASEEAAVKKTTEALQAVFDALDRGEVELDDLPLPLRTRIAMISQDPEPPDR